MLFIKFFDKDDHLLTSRLIDAYHPIHKLIEQERPRSCGFKQVVFDVILHGHLLFFVLSLLEDKQRGPSCFPAKIAIWEHENHNWYMTFENLTSTYYSGITMTTFEKIPINFH
jgi:hypothetical protein